MRRGPPPQRRLSPRRARRRVSPPSHGRRARSFLKPQPAAFCTKRCCAGSDWPVREVCASLCASCTLCCCVSVRSTQNILDPRALLLLGGSLTAVLAVSGYEATLMLEPLAQPHVWKIASRYALESVSLSAACSERPASPRARSCRWGRV